MADIASVQVAGASPGLQTQAAPQIMQPVQPVVVPSIAPRAGSEVAQQAAYNSSSTPVASSQPQQQQAAGGPSSGLMNTVSSFAPSALKGAFTGALDGIGASLGFGSAAGSAASFGTPMTAVAASGAPMSTTSVLAAGGMPGAAQAGFLGSTTTLSGILGPAAIGAFGGGMLARLTGGNEMGGTIGGAIGGAAGGFAAGTAGGIAAGAALGIGAQALNFILPGLGIIAGGLLGGMMGGPRPHPASTFGTTVDASGKFGSDMGLKSKHLDTSTGKKMGGESSNLFSTLGQNGVKFANNSIHGGVDDGKGFYSIGNGPNNGAEKTFYYDVNDKDAQKAAMYDAAKYLALAGGTTEDAFNAGITKYEASLNGGGVKMPMVMNKGADKQTFDDFYQKYKAGKGNG